MEGQSTGSTDGQPETRYEAMFSAYASLGFKRRQNCISFWLALNWLEDSCLFTENFTRKEAGLAFLKITQDPQGTVGMNINLFEVYVGELAELTGKTIQDIKEVLENCAFPVYAPYKASDKAEDKDDSEKCA